MSASRNTLITAIEDILRSDLMDRPARDAVLLLITETYGPRRELPEPQRLTPREAEVYQLVVRASSNRQIADELYISENTVRFHIRNILRKSNAARRTELITRAARTAGGYTLRAAAAGRPSSLDAIARCVESG